MLKVRVAFAVALTAFSISFAAKTMAAEATSPDFHEVYDTISKHLANEQDADLNRDAVEGLLSRLKGRAWLVKAETASTNVATGIITNLFDGNILRIRIPVVDQGLAAKISSTIQGFSGSNNLGGIVLDLRYSTGNDYAAAVAVADLFLEKESPLLDWGSGIVSSTGKTNAIKTTLIVLINRETAAAAEALAGILRSKDRCLILGSTSAGLAAVTMDYPLKTGQKLAMPTSPPHPRTMDYPLKTGQKLRIVTASVKLGNGEPLSRDGVSPDIAVEVNAAAEKAFYADSYRDAAPVQSILPSILGERPPAAGSGTNQPAKSRPLNEAELMRERKERPGVDVDDLPLRQPPGKEVEPEKPLVRDPVLARALDLARGITALQKNGQ